MLRRRRALAITALTVLLLGAGTVAAILRNSAVASLVLYRVPLGPNPRSISFDERTGVAFVGDDNGVSVVDTRHGSLLRHIADTAPSHNVIAVDPRAGHAFVIGPDAATLSMLDARDGRLLRTIVVQRDGYGIPDETLEEVAVDAVHGRAVVVGNGVDTLVSIVDSHNGVVLHTVVVPGSPGGTAIDAVGQRAFVLARDSLGASTVSAIDMRNGSLPRTVALGRLFGVSPDLRIAVDGRSGRLFIGDTVGNVGIFDGRTLRLVTNANVGLLPGTFAVDPRHGYLLATNPLNDSISVLDPRRGRLLRAMSLSRDSTSSTASGTTVGTKPTRVTIGTAVRVNGESLTVDTSTNHVLLATRRFFYLSPGGAGPLSDRGSVMALNIAAGAIRSIPVGLDPVAVAADDAGDHLILVDAGGAMLVHDPDPWGWTPDWLRRLLPWLPTPTSHVRTVSPALDVIDATHQGL